MTEARTIPDSDYVVEQGRPQPQGSLLEFYERVTRPVRLTMVGRLVEYKPQGETNGIIDN